MDARQPQGTDWYACGVTETPEYRRWRNARLVAVVSAAVFAANVAVSIGLSVRGIPEVVFRIALLVLVLVMLGMRARFRQPRPPKFPSDPQRQP